MSVVCIEEKIIILAGGFGTRLQEVVADVPKPLAPICGKPFLHYLLNNFIKQGARNFIVSLYYKSDLIIEFIKHFNAISSESITVEWVIEPEPLGTGGAVKFIVDQLGMDGGFFVVNGDTYLPDGFSLFKEMSQRRKYAISLTRVPDVSRYGAVILGNNGRIRKFTEKGESNSAALINAGIYKMSSEIFNSISENTFSVEDRVFPLLVQKGELYGFENSSLFIDIGIPEDYRKLCEYISNQMM